MVLYRLADKDDTGTLLPPRFASHPNSVASSFIFLSSDSKYPSCDGRCGLVPYAYDPTIDEKWLPDEEDMLHDPEGGNEVSTFWTWRGVINVGGLSQCCCICSSFIPF
jgi:beta-glucan synthesis-associated protein KRE6